MVTAWRGIDSWWATPAIVAAMLACCVSSSTDWCVDAAEQPDPASAGTMTGARLRTARYVPAAAATSRLVTMTTRRLGFKRRGRGWLGRLLGTCRSYRRDRA